ncbi:hypothetical protein [Novosphingobium sp. BL-8A]|uniref:hypothetical protein n=1 Tax=Novosphingobium sp. BL-8A TaxID=3127639 RepID=UPI003756B612
MIAFEMDLISLRHICRGTSRRLPVHTPIAAESETARRHAPRPFATKSDLSPDDAHAAST